MLRKCTVRKSLLQKNESAACKKSYRPQQISYTTYFFKNTTTQRKLKILATFFNSKKKQSNKMLEMLECDLEITFDYFILQNYTKISVVSSKILFRKSILILWHAKVRKTCIYKILYKLPRQYLTYAAAQKKHQQRVKSWKKTSTDGIIEKAQGCSLCSYKNTEKISVLGSPAF